MMTTFVNRAATTNQTTRVRAYCVPSRSRLPLAPIGPTDGIAQKNGKATVPLPEGRLAAHHSSQLIDRETPANGSRDAFFAPTG